MDGVEVHAVHEGYTLDQFAIKYTSTTARTSTAAASRTAYRFAADIVKAIKERCGERLPRVPALLRGVQDQGLLPGRSARRREISTRRWAATWPRVGDRRQVTSRMRATTCSTATTAPTTPGTGPIRPAYMPQQLQPGGREPHQASSCDIPVVCAGRMEPAVAAARHPRRAGLTPWAWPASSSLTPSGCTKLMEGREEDIKPCICCHNACFTMAQLQGLRQRPEHLMDAMPHGPLRSNPADHAAATSTRQSAAPTSPRRVAVIGGGIGGMECALVLTTPAATSRYIFEKTDHAGRPVHRRRRSMSFKENDKELIDWYRREIAKRRPSRCASTPR